MNDKQAIKENKRTSHEWDSFLAMYGPINTYDDLSAEGKQAAIMLAEKQGERWNNINALIDCEHQVNQLRDSHTGITSYHLGK